MAQLIEVVAHYGGMNVFALTRAKKLPPPGRIYEHDERPGSARSTRRVLSVSEFEEQQRTEGGDDDAAR